MRKITRRDALRQAGTGFGIAGLASMLGATPPDNPWAPRQPHFAPKAKHVIFLFQRDVLPIAQVPKADGSNRGSWEFIRLVSKFAPEAFWTVDPIWGAAGWAMTLLFATVNREQIEGFAAGPVAQNAGRKYTLTPAEKAYLATLGTNADELLAKANARTDIVANARARDYLVRFGGCVEC